MNLLRELLLEARDEMLQEAWDRTLLAAFRSTAYPLTGQLCDKFQKDHKINRDTFHQLKRVPRYSRHFKTRIPRFIAAYLPLLNDRLYDTKLSDDEIIVWMRRVQLDTEHRPADARKAAYELSVRTRSDNQLAANTIQYAQHLEKEESYGRKWSTVKQVRSKTR